MSTKTKAELQAELESALAELKALKESKPETPVTPVVTQVIKTPKSEVTLVYLSDSPGYLEVGDLHIHASVYGEEFGLSRQQFDALVGKYRSWFKAGILAVSPDDVEVAAAKRIRTSAEYKLSLNILERLGTMSLSELEKVWNSLDCDEHKRSVVTFYKRKFIEGDEPGYRDRARVDLLDRLTDGGFKREREELFGSYKINPTIM